VVQIIILLVGVQIYKIQKTLVKKKYINTGE